MNVVKLQKRVFEQQQYTKVIDTSFNQLKVEQPTLIVTSSLPTVAQFFDFYNQLFYDIPETGTTNSHEYLIAQSSAYIGSQQSTQEVDALLEEIDDLRRENLALNQQISTMQTTGSNATV